MTQIQVNNPHKRMEARGAFQNNPVFITILTSQVEKLYFFMTYSISTKNASSITFYMIYYFVI